MNYFIPFSSGEVRNKEKKSLGSKFENLNRLHRKFNVPMAMCVTAEFLNIQISKYIKDTQSFQNYFKELESTAGCYLLSIFPKIEEAIARFHFDEEGRKLIIQAMKKEFQECEGAEFAVRSSASHEDSGENSFAGIYETILNVPDFEAVVTAMEQSVKAYYSYGAIVARIRTNNYSALTELNLIIQKMVKSDISGVAFSSSVISKGKVLIEWVYGLGEQLVSGTVQAHTFYQGMEEEESSSIMKDKLLAVEQAVLKIKEELGFEVDVEWSYENDILYILQSRPITTESFVGQNREEYFEYDKLYFETHLEYEGKLGACKNVYENYTGKRSPFYVLAQKNDIHFGVGYVFCFNKKGLEKSKEELEALFADPICKKVVIDVDDTIRQNIILKEELYDYLWKMFEAYSEKQLNTVIVRMFISGTCGCISNRLGGENVIIEYSKDGLLAMNRGLADCRKILADGSVLEDGVDGIPLSCIEDIVRFTKKIPVDYKYMVEWVINEGKAFFVDFSAEIDAGINCIQESSANQIIVPGNIEGPIFELLDKEILEKLSVSPGVSVNETNDILLENPYLADIITQLKDMSKKPIIFVEKPYAILSFLFDYVEGFVFNQGALLCHLSILLREYKKPAIISKESRKIAEQNESVMIVNGKIIGV